MMALQSRLFKGDRRLEACLVKDAAHITQGAAGDYVAKIQRALYILEGVSIDSSELSSRAYGRSTAAAVLAYKKQRNIINRSYQTQADNIVGKMTVAALDKELLGVRLVPASQQLRYRIATAGRPPAASRRLAAGSAPRGLFASPPVGQMALSLIPVSPSSFDSVLNASP
jgi:hypothetical protein